MKHFLYDVRRKTKSFDGVDFVSFHCESSTPIKKIFRAINFNGERRRLNTETGEISEYTSNDFSRSLAKSLKRSLRNFEDIALANKKDWQFFGTLTFDRKKIGDRYDFNNVYHYFDLWRKYIKRAYPKIKYLVVIELHEDGAIHFHLMMGGVSAEDIQLKPTRRKDVGGRTIYVCDSFKYGRTDFTYIEDIDKTIDYCKKYISKNMGRSSADFKHRFYYSDNCKKPIVKSEIVKRIADKKQLKIVADNLTEHNIFCSDYYVSAKKDFIIKKIVK